jgi:hypothetical protein
MAESKFTPGPWVVRESTTKNTSQIRAGSIFLAAAVGGFSPGDRTTPEETRANAELMADAPRLLEVLRKVLEYSHIDQSWLTIDEAEQAFAEAHDLLDKHGG